MMELQQEWHVKTMSLVWVVLPAYGCSFSPAELLVLLGKPAELDYQSSPRRQKGAGGG